MHKNTLYWNIHVYNRWRTTNFNKINLTLSTNFKHCSFHPSMDSSNNKTFKFQIHIFRLTPSYIFLTKLKENLCHILLWTCHVMPIQAVFRASQKPHKWGWLNLESLNSPKRAHVQVLHSWDGQDDWSQYVDSSIRASIRK